MKNLFHIIGKNLKLLIRSRSSALIIILAPLLVILLVGLAFDNSEAFGLNIGWYSPESGSQVDTLISRLGEQGFGTVNHVDEEQCIREMKIGTTNTCIIFPANIEREANAQKEITFYVDYSKINLVYMIMDTLGSEVSYRSQEVSKSLVGNLLSTLQSSKSELESKQALIAQLKSDTSAARVTVTEITTNLAAINITVDDEALTLGAIQNLTINASAVLNDYFDLARGNISKAQGATNTSSIVARLNDALESISEAEDYLNDNGGAYGSISEEVVVAKAELEAIRAQVETANSVVVGANTNLVTLGETLDQADGRLAQVESSFTSIIGNINAIAVTNPDAIAAPLVSTIKPVTVESTYLNYLFPSLLVLVVMFISILIGTTLVMMEKHSPAYFRNFITPTKGVVFVLATYFTTMILVLIQLAIILGIAAAFFSSEIIPSLHVVAGILLLGGSFFSLFGMAIGYVFNSEETGTLAAISMGSVFLLLSNVILPLESMPVAIRDIAVFNPFIIVEDLVRGAVFFQPVFSVVMEDYILLGGYIVLFFLFVWAAQTIVSKHIVQKLTHRHHKKTSPEKKQREREESSKAAIAKKNVRVVRDQAVQQDRRDKSEMEQIKASLRRIGGR